MFKLPFYIFFLFVVIFDVLVFYLKFILLSNNNKYTFELLSYWFFNTFFYSVRIVKIDKHLILYLNSWKSLFKKIEFDNLQNLVLLKDTKKII